MTPFDNALESILKRDRSVVLLGLASLAALAWSYLFYDAWHLQHPETGLALCCVPQTYAWTAREVFFLFLMWTLMMVAMMVPSVSPMVLIFASLNRKRRQQENPCVPTGMFLLGYLAVWTTFSALAATAQWALHATALLSPMMVSTSPVLGGVLLMAAGVFQWTPLKNACLTHCRSPLGFLMSDWREGKRGAFLMGLKHGAYCTGCCWVLMALLFVAGVMNLWWVAVLAIFVLVEKVAPKGLLIDRIAGVLLAVWGAWLIGDRLL